MDGYELRFAPENAGASFHFDVSGFELDFVPVPEPSTAVLFGFGLSGLAARGRIARAVRGGRS